jgi:F-type H+-transporting ATPase subunit delta
MNAASRYASSLLQLAVERNEIEKVYQDMQFISRTLKDSRELWLALKSPIISKSLKSSLMNTLFYDNVSKTTQAFIDLLLKKRRIVMLAQTAEAFKDQYNHYAGIIEVEITTSEALSKDQEEKLVQKLQISTGKKITLKPIMDSSILGGIKARIDDTVIDGTVQHKLETLRKTLIQKG